MPLTHREDFASRLGETQFTDRFGKHGTRNAEVLFDKVCRRNGITHRLTSPASPNQNGKVERFHGTFCPEIAEAGPFESLAAAQAAVDPGSSTTTVTGRTRASTRRRRSCPRTGSRPPRHRSRAGWSSGYHRPLELVVDVRPVDACLAH